MEKDKRIHRVHCDYGCNDYFVFFKKKNKESNIDRPTYGKILKEYNNYVRDRISKKGVTYILPAKMGRIELRKIKTEVKINDEGEIVNNLPTNWKETRKLWKENEAAREKKIKIKFTNEHTEGYTFRISYFKAKANYKNKSIYKMNMNRKMKRDLSKSIFQGKIDAFLKE